MSKRSSPRKKKKEEKDKAAKVHRITGRHQEEMKMTHYARELDKIYTKLGKAHMVPQVVQKMRTEYVDDPHELYLKVCHKWGVEPEKRYDQYLLVYGKKTHEKFKSQEDRERENAAKDRDWEYKADEEKSFKFDLKQNRKPNLKVITQSPRRAKQVERMYQRPKRPRNNVNQSEAQQRRSSQRDYNSYNERKSPSTSPRLSPRSRKIEYVHIHAGDLCETMVLTNANKNQETGFWIQARVLAINSDKETLDLQVLEPKKYGLSALAKDVPNRYVRSPAQMSW